VIAPFEGAGISLHINEKFTNEKVEELEDTKKEIRIRKSKKDRKHNGQKKKKDTKGVIIIRVSKNRQHNEDTKGVIIIRVSKNRQHNGQKKIKGQTTIYKTYT